MTRRILVALDDGDIAGALLDAAVRLAARRHAELVGVYVEEAAMLESLGLPFVRTFRDAARGWEAAEPSDLLRAFRVQAARLRRQLETRAAVKRIAWTFSVRRGTPTTEIAASVANPDDLLIVGAARHAGPAVRELGSTAEWLAGRMDTALLVMRPGEPASVVAIFDGDTAVLATAGDLAAAYAVPLRIAVPVDADESSPSVAAAARRWLTDRGMTGDVEILSGGDAEARRRGFAALQPGLAVINRETAERYFGDLGRVMRDAPATWCLLPGDRGACGA